MLKPLLQRFVPRTLRWFPHHPGKCEVVEITIRYKPMNPDGTYGALSTASWDQWVEALKNDFIRWVKFWRR